MANDTGSNGDRIDGEENQQRDRADGRDRDTEAEPVHGESTESLDDLDEVLSDHEFPATGAELRSAYGDYELETQNGLETLDDVLSRVDAERYESADDVRNRIQGLIHR